MIAFRLLRWESTKAIVPKPRYYGVAVNIVRLAADGTSASNARTRPTYRRPLNSPLPKAIATTYYGSAMNTTPARDNPFSTRRVRPGAMPFIFPAGQDAETLVDRLRQAGWWGEIIGRHGSGKSSLLAALTAAIERAGQRTVLVTLHDGQRRLPLDLQHDSRLRPPVVLIVDGYEQLGRWRRPALRRFCRRQGIGLLVTAHESMGLPLLCQTVATVDLAEQLVRQLLGGQQSPLTPAEVSQALSRRGGDLREMLFDLYDLYEQRR